MLRRSWICTRALSSSLSMGVTAPRPSKHKKRLGPETTLFWTCTHCQRKNTSATSKCRKCKVMAFCITHSVVRYVSMLQHTRFDEWVCKSSLFPCPIAKPWMCTHCNTPNDMALEPCVGCHQYVWCVRHKKVCPASRASRLQPSHPDDVAAICGWGCHDPDTTIEPLVSKPPVAAVPEVFIAKRWSDHCIEHEVLPILAGQEDATQKKHRARKGVEVNKVPPVAQEEDTANRVNTYDETPSPVNTIQSGELSPPPVDRSTPLCLHGLACIRQDCRFRHPSWACLSCLAENFSREEPCHKCGQSLLCSLHGMARLKILLRRDSSAALWRCTPITRCQK